MLDADGGGLGGWTAPLDHFDAIIDGGEELGFHVGCAFNGDAALLRLSEDAERARAGQRGQFGPTSFDE
jgi:hypothetical protein